MTRFRGPCLMNVEEIGNVSAQAVIRVEGGTA